MSDRVLVSIVDGVATVTMNRAEKRNALDGAMFVALADAGRRLTTEQSVRAVVLHGDGASFCAGLDMGLMGSLGGDADGGSDAPDASDAANPLHVDEGSITHLGQKVCWVWQEVPVPVIAAVHGHAMGGGLQIALGADIRVVHPDTKLSVREVAWGLIPDMTGTFMLARLVRPDVARELTFTGRIFTGAEAGELGVATRLSDDPLATAQALAAEIAGNSPSAVRGAKELFSRIDHEGAAEQFAAERRVVESLLGSPDQREAVDAGLAKRAPVFRD